MTDTNKLKELAERALDCTFDSYVALLASAKPQEILGLIDEVERIKAENEALLLGMRAILNAYDYADQYNKEGVAVEVMEDLRALFKGATK
ncbi:TPA: hypothetical protein L4R59_001041 [Pseudomonas aeruginosa]|uniref:hypothetical protein n=1 Tax=Pseudomonas aeruginosa TaxID=287 RepID=UPI0012DAE1ED|nr:hypothetical protein [Pseudomonas aeruginosa]MUH87283.1 hypothetical protein [Pseudomonas aeruginosa]HBO3004387.1 hypothetical protein [Pseudomonas aeruginosa]HBO4694095.1 hypothetical protein [Pseudomonas aeruginosa]